MSYEPVDLIEVFAWGRRVGAIAPQPGSSHYVFEYEPDWLASGVDLAPLAMPRRSGTFAFPNLSRETYYGLPGLVADALPDRFGNAMVDAWMVDEGIDPRSVSALDRLAYAGNRTMGALTFAPPMGPHNPAASIIQVADLVTAARSQLEGRIDGAGIHDALQQLIAVGSTAGGLRAKAVIAYNPETDQIRSGQLDAPEGFEHWLLKLDGVGPELSPRGSPGHTQPFCRVEYAYYLMAGWAGVEMAESKLLLEGERAHFLTKRFDRAPGNVRIHTETLCGLAHLDFQMARTHSYGSYFLTASELGLGREAFEQIFRRIAFNVTAINRDDHTKNFSFLLPETGVWRLAPAYDVTHSYWEGEWTSGHQMSINRRFADITLEDLRALGDQFGVPGINRALREVGEAVDRWTEAANLAEVDEETSDRVGSDIERLRPR